MKRILFFAAAMATVLSSCTKQVVDQREGMDDGTIGFESYVGSQTKGSSKNSFVMGDQFYVFGGSTGLAPFDVANINFNSWVFQSAGSNVCGTAVTNYGNDQWRYPNPISWSTDNVTFIGFSPVPTQGEDYGIANADYSAFNGEGFLLTESPKIGFTVKGGYQVGEADPAVIAAARAEIKNQVDLMYALTADKNSKSGPVDMHFNHALSQLRFSIRANHSAGTLIRVNSITLTGVVGQGVLTLAHDESQKGTLTYIGGWEPDAAAMKQEYAVNLRNEIASAITGGDNTTLHPITDNDEALMMIPQSLTGIELIVKYAYSADNGVNWENYENGTAVTVPLDQVASHWNPNKRYNYVLNITPGQTIGFTADIVDWSNEIIREYDQVSPTFSASELKTYTLEAGDLIKGVYTNGDNWLTFSDATSNVDTDLANGVAATAAADAYTFKVKENPTTATREAYIEITKLNAENEIEKIIKISVVQGPNSGVIIKSVGGEVIPDGQAGDNIVVLSTKAITVNWLQYTVSGQSAVDLTDVTGAADAYTISALPNLTNAVREVNFSIERAGSTTVYAYKQDAAKETAINVVATQGNIAGIVLAQGDVIKANAAASWITLSGGTASDLNADITVGASDNYVFEAAENTGAERTATVTVVGANDVTIYTITQAGKATPADDTVTLTADAAGVITGSFNVVEGDIIAANATSWISVKANGSAVDLSSNYNVTADAHTLEVAANTGAARTATLVVNHVAGNKTTYTINQDAYTPVDTPVAVAVVIAGGDFTADMTGLALSEGDKIKANAAATWITLSGGAATDLNADITVGAGETYAFTAGDNAGNAGREVVIVVERPNGDTHTFTVTQAGV